MIVGAMSAPVFALVYRSSCTTRMLPGETVYDTLCPVTVVSPPASVPGPNRMPEVELLITTAAWAVPGTTSSAVASTATRAVGPAKSSGCLKDPNTMLRCTVVRTWLRKVRSGNLAREVALRDLESVPGTCLSHACHAPVTLQTTVRSFGSQTPTARRTAKDCTNRLSLSLVLAKGGPSQESTITAMLPPA